MPNRAVTSSAGQAWKAMNDKAPSRSAAAPTRYRYVYRRVSPPSPSKFPQLSGAVVADHSALAAGERCGQPPAFSADRLSADRKNRAMKWVEPPGRHARPDLTIGIAE